MLALGRSYRRQTVSVHALTSVATMAFDRAWIPTQADTAGGSHVVTHALRAIQNLPVFRSPRHILARALL